MKRLLEWFLMLFLKKKALIVRQEAIFERQKAINDYEKVKEVSKKKLSKYSGRKKFVKAPTE